MSKDQEKLRYANRKRQILIADDEMINREILGEILKEKYDVLFAADGGETMDAIRENRSTLSLVLLDILMPVKSGLDILKEMREDPAVSQIPVIVMTSERDMEVESLRLGAMDFIPKPYPAIDVIYARVLRTIELYEDRDIIRSTERDTLTGLYNKEFFFKYVEQFDRFHPDLETDAVLVDINHFRILNERYGRAYGDTILRHVGERILGVVESAGGIVCRQEADTFLVYCPHRDDYEQFLADASVGITGEDGTENRIRLRIGIYPRVDRTIDMDGRFDRAKMAADMVKGTAVRAIGIYDNSLQERQLYAERLIEDFPAAIRKKQFQVYYQPKFDVRPETPMLASAEALVRWMHPELGMISPGMFIPLFEDNGLIQILDTYVWREAARQIREWKDRLGTSIPVSVNVSRVDMYDPKLPDILMEIVESAGLSGKDFYLEVTESAYTEDHAQVIGTVEKLRKQGFPIEMDDFGTGYSSLNMLSSMPIDVLKLDMQFIRSAFREGGNTHMLEVIIGLADYLAVPVIAEGVETEEQLHILKGLGCDIVQGYFFSKPVPAKDFEPFILQKKEAELSGEIPKEKPVRRSRAEQITRKEKMNHLLLNESGAADTDSSEDSVDNPVEEGQKEHTGVHLKTASLCFIIAAFIAAMALLLVDFSVTRGYRRMEQASDRFIAAQVAATDMESGSDYLTDRVRCFVVTGEIHYLNDFIEEVNVTRRRDKAVENLEMLLEGDDAGALDNLNMALSLSNELVLIENRAMRLMLEAGNYDMSGIPEDITGIELSESEKQLSPAQLKEKAQAMVFDSNYMHFKDRIRENVSLCTQSLLHSSSQGLDRASQALSFLVNIQTIMTILIFLIVLGIIEMITRMVRKPLTEMVLAMQEQKEISPTGVEELRFVTRIYNHILQENRMVRERLSHEASHDALTGLFNRGAYDLLMESADKQHIALILIDVDYFKSINDTYGHAVGDRMLKRVAELMKNSFRSVDILCRIGGDEFVVVMTRVNSSMSQLVLDKINHMNDVLQHPKDDLPPASLSVGVAFSDRKKPQGDIFHDADTALYQVKEAGRKGCRIFGEEAENE